MPRQNRVNPFGEIIAVPDRGMFMGNRGVLHDAGGRIRRPFALKRWICCETTFKGRKRGLMQPGRYTELFFLDEATALAAGHRPCKECRKDRYMEFMAHYARANPAACTNGKLTAGAMDSHLHAHRIDADGRQIVYSAPFASLPDGVIFLRIGESQPPRLKWRGRAWVWSFSGYGAPVRVPEAEEVRVLAPRPTVAVLTAGYVPTVHGSAGRSV